MVGISEKALPLHRFMRKVFLKSVTILNVVVILLMNISVCVTVFNTVSDTDQASALHSKQSSGSIASMLLFQKEVDGEGERSRVREDFIGAELIDFSMVAVLLSEIHTPVYVPPHEERYSSRPPLFQLHCNFII